MCRLLFARFLWLLSLLACPQWVCADGRVFTEVYYPKVEIPDQRALIHFSEGIETLVIETSFVAPGTNFAWVVPLPSVPDVSPVSEEFFPALQRAFAPTLVHEVTPYFVGVLLVCGLAVLGARALRDEGSLVRDLPLSLLLAVAAGFAGGHTGFGIVAFMLAVGIRSLARSREAYALLLLVGCIFAVGTIGLPRWKVPRSLVDTMGRSPGGAGVTVLSQQRAGLFDITTIRGSTSAGVLTWLERNGFQVPRTAERAIQQYINEGWVFVASKTRRKDPTEDFAVLHPLAFKFNVSAPVYPMRLTAIDNRECTVELFVFDTRRAAARHFSVTRCERLTKNQPSRRVMSDSGLRVRDPEVLALIGNSTVGTKLSGTLRPQQMTSDILIQPRLFWSTGKYVYSRKGATIIACNIGISMAVVAWLLLDWTRGGWQVNEQWIARWRWRVAAVAVALWVIVFWRLPKVEVESRLASYGIGIRCNSDAGEDLPPFLLTPVPPLTKNV